MITGRSVVELNMLDFSLMLDWDNNNKIIRIVIFNQEAPLTRIGFQGGPASDQIEMKQLGVNFEEGGNRSALREPSRSGWDRLKLNSYNICSRGGRCDWRPARQPDFPMTMTMISDWIF